jgi:hypothetical protein
MKSEAEKLTSWSAPGLSSLGGTTSPARGLRASSPMTRGLRASGLPTRGLLRFGPPPRRWQHSPPLARGLTPGLHDGRGWTVAPAGDEGHLNVVDG